MAAEYNFPIIIKGDTFKSRKIKILKGVDPLDLTGATICMQLKKFPGSVPVYTFEHVVSDPGEITLNSWKVNLPAGPYNYDLKITLADGNSLTYIVGIFTVNQNISECP